MKNQNLLITDVRACYKNIDENNVIAIMEIEKNNSETYEMILKYTFSINKLENNCIEVFKDLKLPEVYEIYKLVKNNPNYKGVFDIYFKIYQNELDNLRGFANEKLNEVNKPKEKQKSNIFEQVKDNTKKLFQEIWEEGSTNELNGSIIKVAAYKKMSPIEKNLEYTNRYIIDIIRYEKDAWENIYSYEYGKYKIGGVLTDINNVSVYKKLNEDEIFKILSLLNNEEEYEVVNKYLKTVPKQPHGDKLNKENKSQIENIKFI